MNRKEWRWLVWVTLALVVASSLPYLVAWAATPEDAHFTGLIFNPQDGNSYIAKMRQGLEGSWRFHLAFTPERGRGAYIFLFHLFLGHLARLFGLPLIAVYHAARVVSGTAMLVALYALISHLSERTRERGTMFLLTILGSGLGWLVGVAGVRTADLWVPEAFPLYSLMANPHFPLAIALMAGIALCGLRTAREQGSKGALRLRSGQAREQGRRGAGEPFDYAQDRQGSKGGGRIWSWGAGMALAAVALGVVQPFGLVPTFGGLGVVLVARIVRERMIPWRAASWIIGAAVVALPYPLYAQWAIRSDPVLAAWNAQNVTPSPSLWNWILSYGLVSVLALLGGIVAARRGSEGDLLLLGWVGVTAVGMALPLPLQRRLSLGLGVPLGLLAGMGWQRLVRPRIGVRRRELMRGIAIALSSLTLVFLMVVVSLAALGGERWFYLSGGEWEAFRWLRDEGSLDDVVLCAPQTGSFVPAWAGQPVVYGHAFETVDAERREAQVRAYWAGEMSEREQETFLEENRVGYVLVGPRELEVGDWRLETGDWRLETGDWGLETGDWKVVFEAGDVRVYEVSGR